MCMEVQGLTASILDSKSLHSTGLKAGHMGIVVPTTVTSVQLMRPGISCMGIVVPTPVTSVQLMRPGISCPV